MAKKEIDVHGKKVKRHKRRVNVPDTKPVAKGTVSENLPQQDPGNWWGTKPYLRAPSAGQNDNWWTEGERHLPKPEGDVNWWKKLKPSARTNGPDENDNE